MTAIKTIPDPIELMQPKIVSFKILSDHLMPKIGAYSWAQKELHDLWLMGAPDPQSKPCLCKDERNCTHQKRVLLPKQFQMWWTNICSRQHMELTAAKAMSSLIDKK